MYQNRSEPSSGILHQSKCNRLLWLRPNRGKDQHSGWFLELANCRHAAKNESIFWQIEYCGIRSSCSTVVLLNFRAGGWWLHCKKFFCELPSPPCCASSSTTPFQKLFYCLMKRGKFCWHWQLRKILHFFLLLLLLCLAKSGYFCKTKDPMSQNDRQEEKKYCHLQLQSETWSNRIWEVS